MRPSKVAPKTMGVHVPQGPDASGGPVKGQSGERKGQGSRRLAVMTPLDQDLQPSHIQGALSPLVGKGAGGSTLCPPPLAGPAALGGPEDALPPEQCMRRDTTAQQSSGTKLSQLLTPPGRNPPPALEAVGTAGGGEGGLQEASKGDALLCDLHQGQHTFPVQGHRVDI